jgi:tRNA (adenine57-N1/adenine58-N1)-methyltransferase|tara:strand:- start:1424 stop:2164 length:741 start_codon:yes stop_codon:yes gene_type:complete
MSNWNLLIIGGSAHLVDLDSDVIEIDGFGSFPGNAIKDQKPGSEFDLLGEKCLIVEYSMSDVQSNLKRGPQIILPKDIAWMIHRSGLKSGDTVIEAGTGSGAFTLSLAQTVAPNGKVITFENNSKHFKIAERNLDMSAWKNLVEIHKAELSDKTAIIKADVIFLDLPDPDRIVPWAEKSLKIGGFMLSYIPTSNQVEKLLVSLDNWKQVEIVEVIQREWQARTGALRPKSSMIGHTGFIMSARWNG